MRYSRSSNGVGKIVENPLVPRLGTTMYSVGVANRPSSYQRNRSSPRANPPRRRLSVSRIHDPRPPEEKPPWLRRHTVDERASPVKRIIEDIGPIATSNPPHFNELLAAPKKNRGGRESTLFCLTPFVLSRPLRPSSTNTFSYSCFSSPLTFLPLTASLPSLRRGPTFRECPFRVCTQSKVLRSGFFDNCRSKVFSFSCEA